MEMNMEVAKDPRLIAVKERHPTGVTNFASFGRIIQAMKAAGEMPKEWEVVSVVLDINGIIFELKNT
jgi:hypothetical protein